MALISVLMTMHVYCLIMRVNFAVAVFSVLWLVRFVQST